MNVDLTRLFDQPATAHLLALDSELQIITLTHDTPDRVTIQRRRVGGSIDLGELLQLIGMHGITEQPTITEVAAPQLPAPVEPPAGAHTCPECGKVFEQARQVGPHRARAHRYRRDGDAGTPKRASKPEPKSARPFPCPHCERSYRSQKVLDTHVALAHWEQAEAAVVRPVEPEPPASLSPIVPIAPLGHICDVCSLPLDEHVRCADCGMPLGRDHQAGPVHIEINHEAICKPCATYRVNGHLERTT